MPMHVGFFAFVFVDINLRIITSVMQENSTEIIEKGCTLPVTTNFDLGLRVCLLLNYFLKRLIWLADIT